MWSRSQHRLYIVYRATLIAVLCLAAQALQAREFEDYYSEPDSIYQTQNPSPIGFAGDSVEYSRRHDEFFYDKKGLPIDRLGYHDFELLLQRKYEQIWTNRACYFSIIKASQRIRVDHLTYPNSAQETCKSFDFTDKMALGINLGRTFYLIPTHRPMFGFLRFGLDGTFIDAIISELDYSRANDLRDDKVFCNARYYLFDVSALCLGPSATINPFSKLKIAGYMHWNPTYEMLLLGPEFRTNVFVSRSWGVSVAFKTISFGFESRNGECEHDPIESLDLVPLVKATTNAKPSSEQKPHTLVTNKQNLFFVSLRF